MDVAMAIAGLKGFCKPWEAGGAGNSSLTAEIRIVLKELSRLAALAELRDENEGLREAMVALLEDAEDMRLYADDWTWKYGTGWDKTLAKAREVLAAALKPADTIVTAPAGLIKAGQKVTREAAETEKGT